MFNIATKQNYKINKVFTCFANIHPHMYLNSVSNPIVCQENTACTYISIMAFRTRYNGIYRTLHRRKSHGNINKSCWQNSNAVTDLSHFSHWLLLFHTTLTKSLLPKCYRFPFNINLSSNLFCSSNTWNKIFWKNRMFQMADISEHVHAKG